MATRYVYRFQGGKKKSTKNTQSKVPNTADDFINQPYPQPKPAVHLPILPDTREGVKVELETRAGVPLLNDQARERLAVEYKKLRVMPRQVCNSCHLSTDCPEFRENYVCAYEKSLQAMPTRDVDTVLAVMLEVQDSDVERWRFARLQERLVEGGQANDKVTRLGETIFNRGERLLEMQRSSQRATVTMVGPSGGDPTKSSGGLLARLFGGTPQGREDMLLQAPAEVVDEVREAAAEELPVRKVREVVEMRSEEEDVEGDGGFQGHTE
jgi:hypothetical protein